MTKGRASKKETLKGNNRRNLNTNRIYEIPFGVKIEGDYFPPPSKSFAIRNLIVASLSENESFIKKIGSSDDIKSALKIIKKWRKIKTDGNDVFVYGWKKEHLPKGKFYVGNSATLARILLGLFSFLEGKRIIEGDLNLRGRDISSSIVAARKIGAKVTELREKGRFPVLVEGSSLSKRKLIIEDETSSQFASGVLIAVSYLKKKCEIEVTKEVSFPYLKMTEETLKRFGAKIYSRKRKFFVEKADLRGIETEVETDFSAAPFFAAGTLATGGKVKIFGLNKKSCQGDKKFFEIIKKTGAKVKWEKDFVAVWGVLKRGIEADLKNNPDLLPPLAVIALKCPSESFFYGILRLKTKESSRAEEIAKTVNTLGGKAHLSGDVLRIIPSQKYSGKVLTPKNDHRLAMTYAFIGTFAKGTIVKNPGCVRKSYPSFWKDFKLMVKRNNF